MLEPMIATLKEHEAELRRRGLERAAVHCQIAWLQLVGLREEAAQEGEVPAQALVRNVVRALLRQIEREAPEALPELRDRLNPLLDAQR